MIHPIDHARWLETRFSKSKPGNWACPICKQGILEIAPERWVREPSGVAANTKRQFYQNNLHGKTERFAAILVCNNPKCQESVAIAGDCIGKYVEGRGYPKPEEREYSPYFFFPALELFPISASCPEKVAAQIRVAFSHYFNDMKASANAIRTSLELLMDAQKVKRTFKDKSGKRRPVTLHARIAEFGNSSPDLKQYLVATKWIGNAGSHVGELTREELLLGFDLLNHAIYELYEKKVQQRSLLRKVKEINVSKRHRLKGK